MRVDASREEGMSPLPCPDKGYTSPALISSQSDQQNTFRWDSESFRLQHLAGCRILSYKCRNNFQKIKPTSFGFIQQDKILFVLLMSNGKSSAVLFFRLETWSSGSFFGFLFLFCRKMTWHILKRCYIDYERLPRSQLSSIIDRLYCWTAVKNTVFIYCYGPLRFGIGVFCTRCEVRKRLFHHRCRLSGDPVQRQSIHFSVLRSAGEIQIPGCKTIQPGRNSIIWTAI